jgi:hypothetical protein
MDQARDGRCRIGGSAVGEEVSYRHLHNRRTSKGHGIRLRFPSVDILCYPDVLGRETVPAFILELT